jgi:hypothetical protein
MVRLLWVCYGPGRRRVGAYATTVTVVGLALLAAAAPAAARAAGRDPGPVLLLAALVLAAELMPLELGRPGTRDSTTMSQPFAFALVLGWGAAAGVVALGGCSALADLAGGKPARKVLFNSAQLATALGAAGVVYLLAGGHPGSGQVGCRPCCWAWPRWSPWSPRPAWGGPRPGPAHGRRLPGLPGRHPGRPGAGPGRGRGRAGPDPPAPGERPAQARPAGHRLPRAEDPP